MNSLVLKETNGSSLNPDFDTTLPQTSVDVNNKFSIPPETDADAITYNNFGKVIPPSERFNQKKKDIRYSLSTDSQGRKLSKDQQEFFKDSKIRVSDVDSIDASERIKEIIVGTPTVMLSVDIAENPKVGIPKDTAAIRTT